MRCPRDWHAPRTGEGRLIAEAMPQIVGQLRVGMGGATGLDLTAALAVTDSMDIGRDVALPLLHGLEAGALWALAPKGDDGQ